MRAGAIFMQLRMDSRNYSDRCVSAKIKARAALLHSSMPTPGRARALRRARLARPQPHEARRQHLVGNIAMQPELDARESARGSGRAPPLVRGCARHRLENAAGGSARSRGSPRKIPRQRGSPDLTLLSGRLFLGVSAPGGRFYGVGGLAHLLGPMRGEALAEVRLVEFARRSTAGRPRRPGGFSSKVSDRGCSRKARAAEREHGDRWFGRRLIL